MASNHPLPPILDEARSDFIQHHVSINVAARDAENRPAVARAFGCSVSADRRAITVFLAPLRAETVLRNLRDNGVIAVVVSRPGNHETLQVKGAVKEIRRVTPRECDTMMQYLQSFKAELTGIGYAPDIVDNLAPEVNAECMAVTFEPAQLFEQTPGPRAGQRLETSP